ncbi:hypothetical protein BpHYR1_025842, partial [Brachionus plicatilis]
KINLKLKMKKQKQHLRKLLQQRLAAEQIQEVVNIVPRSLPTSSTLTSIASSTNELAETSAYITGSIDSVHMIAELCNSILNIDCTQRSLNITLNSVKTCKLHYDTFVADNDDMILNDGRGGKHEPTMPTIIENIAGNLNERD